MAKAQRLTSHGVQRTCPGADAVRQADIVLTMLDDGAVVEQVLFEGGVAAAMARAYGRGHVVHPPHRGARPRRAD